MKKVFICEAILLLSIIQICFMTNFIISIGFPELAKTGVQSPFKYAWDPEIQAYSLMADHVFPLRLYILSLPSVGNARFSNHSDIVAGVIKATEIRRGNNESNEFRVYAPDVFAIFQNAVRINVSISCYIVDDWDSYRSIVETFNNTIILNTHDEYLPVPTGYSKEAWVGMIADFMANRWSTWVNIGGYPMSRVCYQNGTTEEWGTNGFEHLWSYTGRHNITCYTGHENESGPVIDRSNMWTAWQYKPYYDDASLGFPVKTSDFSGSFGVSAFEPLFVFAENQSTESGRSISFSFNQSTFNYGIYVHLGVWRFMTVDGIEGPGGFTAGFLASQMAIYSELWPVTQFSPDFEYSAAHDLIRAETEGRLSGLNAAKTLFQEAADCLVKGYYKMSNSYANQAAAAAISSSRESQTYTIMSVVVLVVTPIGIGLGIFRWRRKNDRKKTKVQ
jgi:hypothetical protein